MIRGISSSGPHIQVNGGYQSGPGFSMSNHSAGMLRYNTSNSSLESYDGTTWVTISGAMVDVGLSYPAQNAIDWAIKKMAEEEHLKALASKHPAVAEAVENINTAYEKLKVVVALTEEGK